MNYSYFIGIDISKEWFDAALKPAKNPRVTKHKQFENNGKGFRQFAKWLKQQIDVDYSKIFICLEHTGVYTIPICQFLAQQGIAYTLIPGAEIANQGITRGKNDKIDAKRIAMYAYKNRQDIRIHTLPNEALRALKILLSLRDRLVKARHGFMVSSKEITRFEAAEISALIAEGSQNMMEQCSLQIKKVESEIDQLLAKNPDLNRSYHLLLSVPGIGRQNALYLIGVTKNFVSFNCPKKFAAYAGIAPFSSSSGKSIQSKSKVSQKANKKIKTLLTNAVVCSLKSCSEYRIYFERQIEKGKNPNSIKNVIRNKIVARAFAVIKRNSPYIDTHAFAA